MFAILKSKQQCYYLDFVFILFTTISAGRSITPYCSTVVRVESVEVFNYLGNVSFQVPSPYSGVWMLRIKTDAPFTFFGGWSISFEVDERSHSLVRVSSSQREILNIGDKVSFRFRLYWATNQTAPKIKNILWENQVICDGAK